MTLPLMPKATAVWLIDNTSLTFKQIADFCGMHELEVKGIADGDVASGVLGVNPVLNSQLTQEELDRCIADNTAKLTLSGVAQGHAARQKKTKSRYTPIARRQDKPDAIYWLVKNYPDLPDSVITKLVGTTKNTIQAIRSREYWNIQNIKPRDPVLLGICTQIQLDAVLAKFKKADEEEV